MSAFDPNIDQIFRAFADLLLRRHWLLSEGHESSGEAEILEDQMDALWEQLNDRQRQSLNGMGSDLNWIRRKGELAPQGPRSAEEVPVIAQQKLAAAMASKDWHEILHCLRNCVPVVPPIRLAYMRATAYDAIEFPLYSSAFYEQAIELDPSNAPILVLALQYLEKVAPIRAAARAKIIIGAPLRFSPVVIVVSAVVLLRQAERDGAPVDRTKFAELLRGAVNRSQLEPPSGALGAMTYQLAAAAFELIDDPREALRCYDEGLEVSPDNELLLVGKGLLLYGQDTAQAIGALKKAADRGTSLVWPYFFLAHHYVLTERYSDSLEAGREAWTKAATNPVRAELLEWRAICLTELHIPPNIVRPIFEQAADYDPSNSQISKNLAAFDDSLARAARPHWTIEQATMLKIHRIESARELELAGAV